MKLFSFTDLDNKSNEGRIDTNSVSRSFAFYSRIFVDKDREKRLVSN